MVPKIEQSENFDAWMQTATNVAINVCSIITMPLEYLLRPMFGSRYFLPPAMLVSMLLMIALGTSSVLSTVLPRNGASSLIGMGVVFQVFLLASVIHSARTFRRMVTLNEEHSRWDGPGLPIFNLLPFGKRWSWVRIFYEPFFIAAIGVLGWFTGLADRTASTFFLVGALALCVKAVLTWYLSWTKIRDILDGMAMGKMLSGFVDGSIPAGSNPQSAQAFVGIPGNLSPAMREAIASGMMPRSVSPEIERLRTRVEPQTTMSDHSDPASLNALRATPDPTT